MTPVILLTNVSSWETLVPNTQKLSKIRTFGIITYQEISWTGSREMPLLIMWWKKCFYMKHKNQVLKEKQLNFLNLIIVRKNLFRLRIWVLNIIKKKLNDVVVRLKEKRKVHTGLKINNILRIYLIKKVNKIAEWNLLQDIMKAPKRTFFKITITLLLYIDERIIE